MNCSGLTGSSLSFRRFGDGVWLDFNGPSFMCKSLIAGECEARVKVEAEVEVEIFCSGSERKEGRL